MALSLSVVIASKNCVDRIEGTILPWKALAKEILVADQMSNDGTSEKAIALGCKVFRNDPANGNFDLNRKLAMQQATGDWILYIDTDERPTSELLAEIRKFLERPVTPDFPAGVRIPNQFYFLGRPLRFGIFNPRHAEIRMMARDKWQYPCEEGFHRGVSVVGRVERFKNPYKHFNVNSLSEWFIKTNQYTEHDADRRARLPDDRIGLRMYSAYWRAFRFFVKHYFFRQGFRDGFFGLVSTTYFMLYHLTLDIKVWERVVRRGKMEERDFLRPLEAPHR